MVGCTDGQAAAVIGKRHTVATVIPIAITIDIIAELNRTAGGTGTTTVDPSLVSILLAIHASDRLCHRL